MDPETTEVKRMYNADERRKLASAGDALPDGSFPIADEADLKNAIAAAERAKDPSAARDHIIKRATELDLEELIPQDWGSEDGKRGSDVDTDADNFVDEDGDGEDDSKKKIEGKSVVKINADGEVASCAKGLSGDACGMVPDAKVCGKCGAMAVQTKDDEDSEMKGEDMSEVEYYEGEVARFDIEDPEERDAYRRLYLEAIGTKSAEIEDGAFVCMTEQKVLDGGTAPCAGCSGGCMGTKGLPDLASLEAVTAQLYGTVIDSGYSDIADRFLVAIERKDGKFEVSYSGDGQFQGINRINEDMIADDTVVTAQEAKDYASASVEGKVEDVSAAVLDGFEVYVVEITGIDGKSYDVFVDPTSGDILQRDAYELTADEVDEAFAEQMSAIDEGATPTIAADPEFEAALREFQMLEAEQDLPSTDL